MKRPNGKCGSSSLPEWFPNLPLSLHFTLPASPRIFGYNIPYLVQFSSAFRNTAIVNNPSGSSKYLFTLCLMVLKSAQNRISFSSSLRKLCSSSVSRDFNRERQTSQTFFPRYASSSMLCCPFNSWRNGLRTSEKQLRSSKEHWKMC